MDEQMREKFEAWFSGNGEYPKAIERSGDGYKLMTAVGAWEAWKACAAALSQPAAAEWIEWRGGAQPVADDIRVDVEFAGGDIESGTVAKAWDWTHCEEEYDIVRYRVTKATP